MRNPYFIDVKMEKHTENIFQLEGVPIGQNDSTTVSALLDDK